MIEAEFGSGSVIGSEEQQEAEFETGEVGFGVESEVFDVAAEMEQLPGYDQWV